jgi:hypothetical protein
VQPIFDRVRPRPSYRRSSYRAPTLYGLGVLIWLSRLHTSHPHATMGTTFCPQKATIRIFPCTHRACSGMRVTHAEPCHSSSIAHTFSKSVHHTLLRHVHCRSQSLAVRPWHAKCFSKSGSSGIGGLQGACLTDGASSGHIV